MLNRSMKTTYRVPLQIYVWILDRLKILHIQIIHHQGETSSRVVTELSYCYVASILYPDIDFLSSALVHIMTLSQR